jgi:hypothetical protein
MSFRRHHFEEQGRIIKVKKRVLDYSMSKLLKLWQQWKTFEACSSESDVIQYEVANESKFKAP